MSIISSPSRLSATYAYESETKTPRASPSSSNCPTSKGELESETSIISSPFVLVAIKA